ncbi:TAXI family TRAP transporter solute-binding subunit [Janibacter melonis]|uniref:TAXI family TRAP transporter solute-binding subunit n=1 Tax=Janibacter melonis TaxID=262209 RepID=UPI001918E890|nr:TAXI family TRAP transporter solute-binding subunit [Janibacter melonis]
MVRAGAVETSGLPARRAVLAGLGGVLLPGTTAGCLGPSWQEVAATSVTIATGNRRGVFDLYGEALAEVLHRRLPSVSVRTLRTDASVTNLREVHRGRADLGFSLGDVAADALAGRGTTDEPLDLAALARTYDSFVHLVVRAGSSISELRDLRGRRVSIGAPGSGTRVVAWRLMSSVGLREDDLDPVEESLQPSADALAQGEIDAFFFVSGLPNTAVVELAERRDIRLVDLGDLVRPLSRRYGAEFTPGGVPASTYDVPAVETVSVKNYLVVRPGLDEALAYAITRVVFEDQAAIDHIAPGVPQPNVGAAIFTSPLPLHPGAARYFREQRA